MLYHCYGAKDLAALETADERIRGDIDPVQLYVSIAALGCFYLSSSYTPSTIFGRNLRAPRALAEPLDHITGLVLGSLRPGNDLPAPARRR